MAKHMANANGITATTTANGNQITKSYEDRKPIESKAPNQTMLMLSTCWRHKSSQSNGGKNCQSSDILLPIKNNYIDLEQQKQQRQQGLKEEQEILNKKNFNDPTIIYTNSNYSKDVIVSDLDQPQPDQQQQNHVPEQLYPVTCAISGQEKANISTKEDQLTSLHHCHITLDGLSTSSNVLTGHTTINGIRTPTTNHSHSPTIHNSRSEHNGPTTSDSIDSANQDGKSAVLQQQKQQLVRESTTQDVNDNKRTQNNCDNDINNNSRVDTTKNLEKMADKTSRGYKRVSLVSMDNSYEVGESTRGDLNVTPVQPATILAKQLSKSGDIVTTCTTTCTTTSVTNNIDNHSIDASQQSTNNNRGPRQCSLGELSQQQEKRQLLPRPSTSNGSNSALKSSSASASGTLAIGGSGAVGRASQSAATLHDRTTKLLIWIMAVFIICELPAGILAALCALYGQEFFENFYMRVGNLTDLFALINSVVNFTLYCLMNPQFKNTFLEVVMRCPRNKNASTTTTGNGVSRSGARSQQQHR